MAKFKIGDLVKLKSGGPVMTVLEVPGIPGSHHCYCGWFAGKKQEKGNFPFEALDAATLEAPAK